MKKLGLLISFVGIALVVLAQGTFSRVKIDLNTEVTMQKLVELGLEADHGEVQKDKWFVSDLSSNDIEVLKKHKIPHEIQIVDVIKFYIERNQQALKNLAPEAIERSGSCKASPQGYKTPKGFSYGSMGGFFSYEEALNKLDSLSILYPDIVSARKPIGNYLTANGNAIHWLKISDNPNVDEAEPQILYNALHHAREPVSLSQLVYYMYFLCENYTTDPEIKALVDQTEMYFVPIVNPDGYQFNFQNNPGGGGLWRKNRRVNGDGTFGVDLNRNYGRGWGANNSGSSPNKNSDVYRGPAAFSEPEIQAMREFCNGHKFKFAMNYHAFGNLLVYPWGYLSKNCEDSLAFREFGVEMSKYNAFKYGTDLETVGYSTNGGSDDWMYGEVATKPLIFSMTPEVGTQQDGFWPSIDRILPLCGEANYMNLTIAKMLLQYAQIEPQTPRLTNKINGHIRYNVRRLGLETPAEFTMSLVPIGNQVSSVGSSKIYGLLPLSVPTLDSIPYSLVPTVANNTEVKFQLKISNQQFTTIDTVSIVYGKIQNILTDPCEDFANWTTSGWSLDKTSSFSGKSSFAENVVGKYPPNYSVQLTNAIPFDFTNAERVEMTYRAKWEIENNYDWMELEISEDQGLSWQNFCTPRNRVTTNQALKNKEVYTGVATDWVYEIVNLDDYVGKKVLIRWTFQSDGGLELQGVNVDEIVVNKLLKSNVGVDLTPLSQLLISPNPASNSVTIQNFPLVDQTMQLSLWNNSGQRVFLEKFNPGVSGSFTFNVEGLPVGLYWVEIVAAEQSVVQKVQIQH